jgi:hypothetical protein
MLENSEFRENRVSDGLTSLKGINYFLSLVSMFIVRLE